MLQTGTKADITEQLSDLSLALLMVVTRDLCRESWVSTSFEVLHRFCNYVFQRCHLCQPKQLFRFLRLEIDGKRDALRRSWFSSRHILDTELRCRIDLFCTPSLGLSYVIQERNMKLTEILEKEGT